MFSLLEKNLYTVGMSLNRPHSLPESVFIEEDVEDEVLYAGEARTLRGRINVDRVRHASAELKEIVRQEFGRGYRYAVDLLGIDPFSDKDWELEINPSGGFGGSGIYMQIPQDRIEAMRTSHESAEYVRSTFVHEFMHYFREQEDVSMFAELIYLAEHEQHERIQEIQSLFDDSDQEIRFKTTYIWAYQKIAELMQTDPRHLAETLTNTPLSITKAVFRAYAQDILQKRSTSKEVGPWGERIKGNS